MLTAHELPYTLQVIDNADHAMNYLDELAQQDRHRSPTIMLLDLHLPQRDGRELLRRVRTIPDNADIGVVVVTGSAEIDSGELHVDADAVLAKPFTIDELLITVRSLTGRAPVAG